MRICIFSDIHGNYEAFHKMLSAESKNAELFIFAGDVFGYFHNQKEIIRDMMKMPTLLAVKGNHDKYYLSETDKVNLINKYGSSYTFVLPTEQVEFIRSLPDSVETTIGGKRIGIFHGGPDDCLEQRIYPDSKVDFEVWQKDFDIVILGHTHYRLEKKVGNTLIINPGSLGQPRDGEGFSYCVLDLDDDSCCFKSVNVNMDELLSQVKEYDADKAVSSYLLKKYRS